MLADMTSITVDKLFSILEFTLSRLARYDEGNPIGALLSMAPKPNSIFNKMKNLVGDQNSQQNANSKNNNHSSSNNNNSTQHKQGGGAGANAAAATAATAASAHLGQAYVAFMRGSSEVLQQVIVDELWVNRLFEVFCVLLLAFTKLIFNAFLAMVRRTDQNDQ